MYGEVSELIEIGRLLHSRGWLPASGGNLSARVENDRVLITASGTHKGHLTREDFVTVDLEGKLLEGSKRPSAETLLHLVVYRNFPRVMSVLHVHSVNSTLISRLAKEDLKLENYELLKAFEGIKTHDTSIKVPVFENAQDMKTLSRLVEKRLVKGDLYGFLLKSHGLYTWGSSIREAYIRLEAFEFLFECELKLALRG
ncbi:MAG: methylthioribulose 1-phosphate dehydratase [Aquificaceae bacterium]|nr:methylthioribulose 1-phosphate dehydratase [Aquificaceae bacterium]MCS7196271.1 methylthioribulose 1-phosphate dehydratase [Aquificaceae bacterium]MDW8032165.1 methylthioribulose 1-phosphate dehydratase [Aquificaceae bacterium]MDW8294138.1 methylthioribulose 1-phosphate dehydratase [Aquificaceae bacterium]